MLLICYRARIVFLNKIQNQQQQRQQRNINETLCMERQRLKQNQAEDLAEDATATNPTNNQPTKPVFNRFFLLLVFFQSFSHFI